MSESKEGFVKREYRVGLEQCENLKTETEEVSLVRKVENGTRDLLQSLNSIEAMTNSLNKSLLPQLQKMESEAKPEQGPPKGWLECHLADLTHALYRSAQIYDEVTRLVRATKTDKVG